MTIPEAAQLVIQAGALSRGSDELIENGIQLKFDDEKSYFALRINH